MFEFCFTVYTLRVFISTGIAEFEADPILAPTNCAAAAMSGAFRSASDGANTVHQPTGQQVATRSVARRFCVRRMQTAAHFARRY